MYIHTINIYYTRNKKRNIFAFKRKASGCIIHEEKRQMAAGKLPVFLLFNRDRDTYTHTPEWTNNHQTDQSISLGFSASISLYLRYVPVCKL